MRLGEPDRVRLRQADRDKLVPADPAVDLEDQLHLFVHEPGRIVDRPRRPGNRWRLPEARPQFFRNMGRKWREQLQEGEGRAATHYRGLLQRVHEDHHLRDGRVEAQRLDVVADLSDRLVAQSFDFWRVCRRGGNLRTGAPVLADILAPHLVEETEHPLAVSYT